MLSRIHPKHIYKYIYNFFIPVDTGHQKQIGQHFEAKPPATYKEKGVCGWVTLRLVRQQNVCPVLNIKSNINCISIHRVVALATPLVDYDGKLCTWGFKRWCIWKHYVSLKSKAFSQSEPEIPQNWIYFMGLFQKQINPSYHIHK